MRILHGADLHLGLTRYGIDPTVSLTTFAELARDLNVALAILAGDTFHSRRPGPEAILDLVRALRMMTDAGVRVVISRGNHDGPGVISVEEGSTTAWLAEIGMEGVYAYPGRANEIISTRDGPINVQVMPYVHRTTMDSAQLEAEIDALANSRLVWKGRSVGMSRRATTPSVFIGHLSVADSLLGVETQMRMGWDLTVNRAIFDRWDYAALGHIHRQQKLSRRAWYAGAPDYQTFDDVGPKGFLLVDIQSPKTIVVEPFESRAKPFQTIDVAVEDLVDYAFESVGPGAIVRLRIHGSPRPADLAQAQRRLKKAGAQWVKLEVIKPPSRKRRESVNPDEGVTSAVRAWLKTQQLEYELDEYLTVLGEILPTDH